MNLITRSLLVIAALITALFVPRDALNFGVIETLVAIILIALLSLVAAFWTVRRPSRQ